MKKTDEQLIVAILQKNEKAACQSIEQGASVDLVVRQKRLVETPDGVVLPLYEETIKSVLMLACQMDLHGVVLSLLEHNVNVQNVDGGRAFETYKSQHTALSMVLESRRLARHQKSVPVAALSVSHQRS